MGIDEQVRALLARGQVDEAATAVIETCGPSILGFLRAQFDEDDARDVFSTFVEDAWRGLPSFRFEGTPRAWCYALARSAASRFRRDPYRRRADRFPTSMASRLAASVADSALQPGGRREALRALRQSLDADDQQLLSLRLDGDLEWEEIAGLLSADGPPVRSAALRKRFERLKERLGRLAQDAGLIE